MDRKAKIGTILDDYLAKLTTLGTPEALAFYLEGRGVRAWCRNMHRCALAEDVTAILSEQGVSNVEITVGGGRIHAMTRREHVARHTPCVANKFINRFDAGYYPTLIHQDDVLGQNRALVRQAVREAS
jgi:hypothetical protein